MSLTHVGMFSGIGGFELAMAAAGIPTLAAAEIDKKARGVLHDRFPETHIYHDVKDMTGDSLRSLGATPSRTVLSAGWPCQGNSVAGRRNGLADPRSGLWGEVVRILAELRPAWFVGENVPGLLSVNGGADFATVVGDLAELGYGFAWRVLDAQHFGVPQRRRRVVIVGRLGDSGRAPAQVLLEPEGLPGDSAQSVRPRSIFARRARRGAADRFAPTLTASYGEQTHQDFDAYAMSDAFPIATPLALRGRDGGTSLEVGERGGPYNTLRAGDGSSSRQPLVMIEGLGAVATPGLAATLTAGQSNPGVSAPGRRQEDDYNLVAFHMTQDPISGKVSPSLGVTSSGMGISYAADVVNALDTAQGGPDGNSAQAGHLIAYQKVRRSGARDTDGNLPPEVWAERSIAPTLSPADLTSEHRAVELITDGVVVRRLTPLETCRLQGYPDGHTATSDGVPQSDSAQYKQHGNGIAVPVFAWVAKRIAAVDGGAA